MSVSSAVKRLCTQRGWSVPDLSRRTGVSRAHIWALLRGHYRASRDNPVLETIERLAWALRVSEGEIVAVYPALVELNRAMRLPFDHYVRLRDIPVEERPGTVEALAEYYAFRRVFWGEPAEDPRRRQKPRKAARGAHRR